MNIFEEPVVLVVDCPGAAIPLVWRLRNFRLFSDFAADIEEAIAKFREDGHVQVVVVDEALASDESIASLREVFEGPVVIIDDHCGGTPSIEGTIVCRPEDLVHKVQEQLHCHMHI